MDHELPHIYHFTKIENNSSHQQLGTSDQINEILNSIKLSPTPIKEIPMKEWQERLEQISKPSWIEKPEYYSSLSIAIFMIIVIVIFLKRNKIKEKICSKSRRQNPKVCAPNEYREEAIQMMPMRQPPNQLVYPSYDVHLFNE